MTKAAWVRIRTCALMLVLSVSAPALAVNTRFEIDLLIVPSGAASFNRAPYPSHTAMVGDTVAIEVNFFHDAPLQDLQFSFATTAPFADGGGMTRLGPAIQNPPKTGPIQVGRGRFTGAGRYKITVRATAIDYNDVLKRRVEASDSVDIVIGENVVVRTPVVVATCLRPSIRITSPSAGGTICVGRATHINTLPTIPGGCAPYTLTVTIRKPDGTTQSLPAVTAAPWGVVFTPAQGGSYAITAEIRNRNGAAGTASVNTNAVVCPTLPGH
jgi:hypothetical protein